MYLFPCKPEGLISRPWHWQMQPPYTLCYCVSFLKSMFRAFEAFTREPRHIVYAIICKRCNMSYNSETDRKTADRFREHLIDILKETPKPISLQFNSFQPPEADISVTVLTSCCGDRVTGVSLKNRFLYRICLRVLHPFTPHTNNCIYIYIHTYTRASVCLCDIERDVRKRERETHTYTHIKNTHLHTYMSV